MSETAATETTATPQTDTAAAPSSALESVTATASETQQQQSANPEGEAEAKPAEYAEFKLPDGMAKDSKDFTDLVAVAKDMGLSQEAAQKFIDREAAGKRAQSNAVYEAGKAWAEQSAQDKEFGGDGYKENLSFVAKALDTFGTPELGQLLKNTGLINHPEVLRVFFRAGKAISEDKVLTGAAASKEAPKSAAQRMYPNMNP